MQGVPEGTAIARGGRRRPRYQLVFAIVFVMYLTFRLIEALVHLVGSL